MSIDGTDLLLREPTWHTNLVNARYRLFNHVGDLEFTQNDVVPTVLLNSGTLVLDNLHVQTARFARDHVSWVRRTADHYTSGVLHLNMHKQGLHLYGTITVGATEATAVTYNVVGTSVPTVTYTTRITKKRYPEGQDPTKLPDDAWTDGLPLRVTYEQAVGGDALPMPKVYLDDQAIEEKDAQYVTWRVTENRYTHLDITLDADTCGFLPQLYKNAHLVFDMLDPVPEGAGEVRERCSDEPQGGTGGRQEAYLWRAVPQQPGQQAEAPSLPETSTGEVFDFAEELSLAELMTLGPDETVNDFTKPLFVRNMKYSMGQDSTQRDWLENLLGERPPAIDDDNERKMVDQGKDFYQKKLAPAYLTKAFQQYSGPHSPERRLDGGQEKVLDDFLKAGLAKEKDFTLQQQGIFEVAYLQAKPRLQAYIADGRDAWAQKLHKALLGTAHFVLTVNALMVTHDTTAVNHSACMLGTLDTSGKLANDYYQAVMVAAGLKTIPKISHRDAASAELWLPEVLRLILTKIADGDLTETGISKEQAREILAELNAHQREMAQQLAQLFQAGVGTTLLQQVRNVENSFSRFAENWPKMAKMGRLLFVAAWAGAVFGLTMSLINGDWTKMSERERIEAITQITQLSLQMFESVPEVWRGAKAMGIKTWRTVLCRGSEEDILELAPAAFQRLTPAGEQWSVRMARTLQGLFKAGSGIGKGTIFERIFAEGVISGSLKVLGVAASVVMTGLTLWQLISDIRKNGSVSTITFDSLIFAFTLLSTMCLIADLFFAAAALPIAGALLALAGVVISIIAAFKEKPANPLTQWMDNVGIPFVNALRKPSMVTA
ncbi:hypothetical protein ABZ543_34510 [Streptomyces roseifaciens]